jgi:hypothetical protein
LILYGVLVIGLVDNLLRPFLVGKGSKLPDYVVLISTLGRHRSVRPQRFCHRAVDCRDVHGELGNLRHVAAGVSG